MNISTTFLNALRHTSSDVEGQRSPEILLGQIYKVSLEDKSFLLPLAGGEFRLSDPFYYEWNPFPSYLLLYTLEGSAVLTTRGSEVVLDHEHLLFLDCSQGFSLRLLQGKWRFQMFFLSGAELSSYYSIFQAAFTCCYPIPIGSCVSQRMQQLTKFSLLNSHPSFPFCKRVSHFESDLQILYPTFHFCNDFPVFFLAFMI